MGLRIEPCELDRATAGFTVIVFFFSSRRRHTRSYGDWSSDVCSSDLLGDDARQVGNLDGETTGLEIWGKDCPPGTTAKLEVDFPGRRELHHVLLQFSSDGGDRNRDDEDRKSVV